MTHTTVARNHIDSHTVLSCQARVITGGAYLVSDRKYLGTALSPTARFYACFDFQLMRNLYINKPFNGGVLRADGNSGLTKNIGISFRSPQFKDGEWSYLVSYTPKRGAPDGNISIMQMPNPKVPTTENKYLERAALESLRMAFAIQGANFFVQAQIAMGAEQRYLPMITVVLLADNAFYCQPKGKTNLPRFNPLGIPISEARMTGLGSSSAMVTAVCAAILHRMTPILSQNSPPNRIMLDTRKFIQNIASYVHLAVSDEKCTGLDVCAAVWSNHVYRTYTPECIHILKGKEETSTEALLKLLHMDYNPYHTKEEHYHREKPIPLPPMTTFIVAHIDDSSRKPVSLEKVVDWKEKNPKKAETLWNKLFALDERVVDIYMGLYEAYGANAAFYTSNVLEICRLPHNEVTSESKPVTKGDSVKSLFSNLRGTMQELRKLFRQLGEETGEPIEPSNQTQLMDECEKLPGVIGCGIPNKGGHDSIYAFVFTPKGANQVGMKNLQKLWDGWTKTSIQTIASAPWDSAPQVPLDAMKIQYVKEVQGLQKIVEANGGISGSGKQK